MDETNKQLNKWDKRDAKRLSKERFTSDNRRSVRWLYTNLILKSDEENANEDNSSNMPRV